MDGLDETTNAQRRGESEAKSFDLHLRDLESREREDRLTRLVIERPDLSATPEQPVLGTDAVLVAQLKRQVELLAEYQRAVVYSKGWRLVQILRRLTGRRPW